MKCRHKHCPRHNVQKSHWSSAVNTGAYMKGRYNTDRTIELNYKAMWSDMGLTANIRNRRHQVNHRYVGHKEIKM